MGSWPITHQLKLVANGRSAEADSWDRKDRQCGIRVAPLQRWLGIVRPGPLGFTSRCRTQVSDATVPACPAGAVVC